MGHTIKRDDVIFTWELSPNIFCVIKVDYLEKFIESIQEARTKDAPTALTRCDDLLFENSKDKSIRNIQSPSIKVRGSNIFSAKGVEESGYTDRKELEELQNWFYKEDIRTKVTSSIL